MKCAVQYMRYIGVFFCAALLSSCSAYLPHLRVMRANYNFHRGEYQSAIVDYLRAFDSVQHQSYLSYNLANVYHFLGESDAALTQWNTAQNTDDTHLLFGTGFNLGVYYYGQGRYEEALEQFRFVLSVSPRSINAKKNIELTLQKLSSESEIHDQQFDGENTAQNSYEVDEDNLRRMFDYLRRKEEQTWHVSRGFQIQEGVLDW